MADDFVDAKGFGMMLMGLAKPKDLTGIPHREAIDIVLESLERVSGPEVKAFADMIGERTNPGEVALATMGIIAAFAKVLRIHIEGERNGSPPYQRPGLAELGDAEGRSAAEQVDMLLEALRITSDQVSDLVEDESRAEILGALTGLVSGLVESVKMTLADERRLR